MDWTPRLDTRDVLIITRVYSLMQPFNSGRHDGSRKRRKTNAVSKHVAKAGKVTAPVSHRWLVYC